MIGRVPVARRALFQDRRRAALAAGGVAAALLLVLLLQGIFDGAMRQVTIYIGSSPADVFVSEKNVKTMHMSVSSVSSESLAQVRELDGVAWAEGIRYTTTFVINGKADQQLSYVIGYDTATDRGGPRRITTGQAPGRNEIALERIAAQRLGVGIGATVRVFNAPFRVSGLFRGGTTIVNSIAFIRNEDFLARHPSPYAYLLVKARPGVSGGQLQRRVAAAMPGNTVQTRAGFAHEEAALVRDMSADIIRIMTLVGLLIALAVIALSLFTLTLAKLREHAVVKALGAGTRRLVAVVLAQAMWSVTSALALATALALIAAALICRLNPAVSIVVEPRSVARIGVAALFVGAVGALAPLRRVLAIDPASAFRRAS